MVPLLDRDIAELWQMFCWPSGNKCATAWVLEMFHCPHGICPSCDKITIARAVANGPGYTVHTLWNVGLTLGWIPSNIRPLLPEVLSLLTCQFQQGFRICVGGSGGKGSIFCNTMAQTKFKCSDILIQISNHSHFLCLTYVAVTDPCHAMNYRCESHVAWTHGAIMWWRARGVSL